jgi:hypothetical protein
MPPEVLMPATLRPLLLLSLLATSGCVRTYNVTRLDDAGHYVVVQSAAGGMKVYDCQSEPLGTYNPTCVRVDFRSRPLEVAAPAPSASMGSAIKAAEEEDDDDDDDDGRRSDDD